ncbi:MAG TPA: hypothetical protein VIV60_16950 [Polyangiaceae bacterium]
MRILQRSFFLGLFAMTLAGGCTITTTDGVDNTGGEGGADMSTGGTKATTAATGGATSVAGAATGGTTAGTTTPAFTAAECAANATVVPAAYPDILPACIACVYGTSTCTDTVACHNSGTCWTEMLQILECTQLMWLANGEFADPDSAQSCSDMSSTGMPAGATVTPISTDPNAWKGVTAMPSDVNASIHNNILLNCGVECNAANP